MDDHFWRLSACWLKYSNVRNEDHRDLSSGGKAVSSTDATEIKRLKAELRRVTEERDILKKATAFFAKDHV